MAPTFKFTDPGTGQTRVVELTPRNRPNGLFGETEPKRASIVGKRQVVPLDPCPRGKLDFGPGRVLTLGEIIRKASVAFGIRYELDDRASRNNYFVSGQFDEATLANALEFATAVPAAKPHVPRSPSDSDIAFLKARIKSAVTGKVDVTWLRDQMGLSSSHDYTAIDEKYGTSEELDAGDLNSGARVIASSLTATNPGLASFFQQQGIGPNTSLSLGYNLALTIGCPGASEVDGGWSNGAWSTAFALNQVRFLISR